jgi:hypothetical protein
LRTTLVDGRIGAFGFAGTAVNAFVGDHYSHSRISLFYLCVLNHLGNLIWPQK